MPSRQYTSNFVLSSKHVPSQSSSSMRKNKNRTLKLNACVGACAVRAVVGGKEAVVRWYDARQRCCLRLLATWLKVPWKMVANFECLLVYRLMLPPEEAAKAGVHPWDQSIRVAKIGAATVGIGALFAVSGPFSILLPSTYMCMTQKPFHV